MKFVDEKVKNSEIECNKRKRGTFIRKCLFNSKICWFIAMIFIDSIEFDSFGGTFFSPSLPLEINAQALNLKCLLLKSFGDDGRCYVLWASEHTLLIHIFVRGYKNSNSNCITSCIINNRECSSNNEPP